MDKVAATLRTLGVLLALWVILLVAGIVAGVVPLDRLGATATPEPEVESDAGVAEADGGVIAIDAGARVRRDAGTTEVADVEPTAPPAQPARFAVCPGSNADPSLEVAHVFGDMRPEIVVGCPDGWHVLGQSSGGLARIAVFTVPSAPPEQRASAGRAAVGDVDGDGVVDLVLPLAYETAAGASRGGNLYWVPGSAYGGVRDPLALAPIAGVSAAIAPLDGAPGAEVVAMNRTNALAQLPSEAWVFGGGAAPARRTALPTGLDGRAVRIGDLDRDGRADVVVASRGRVDLHFGDGSGAFPRSHSFELEGAREVALGDLDGDGGEDLAVLGGGLRWIRGGAVSGMEPRAVDGVPATLRGLELADVDGDGKLDFVGWDHPRLAVLRHRGELDFTAETAFTLAGPFGPRRHRVADLDGDGRTDDVVLLGSSADEGAPLEVVLLHHVLGADEATTTVEPSDSVDVLDAPLVVRATLPE